MALAATSLVAAIPAGIMAALGIMAFLSHTEHMKPIVMGVMGGVTLMGIVIGLMPVAILVGKRQSKPQAASKAESEAVPSGASGAQTAEIVADDGADEAVDEEDTESMSDDLGGSTGEFQFEDDAFLDEEESDSEK